MSIGIRMHSIECDTAGDLGSP